jgi:hypothetical protein
MQQMAVCVRALNIWLTAGERIVGLGGYLKILYQAPAVSIIHWSSGGHQPAQNSKPIANQWWKIL